MTSVKPVTLFSVILCGFLRQGARINNSISFFLYFSKKDRLNKGLLEEFPEVKLFSKFTQEVSLLGGSPLHQGFPEDGPS